MKCIGHHCEVYSFQLAKNSLVWIFYLSDFNGFIKHILGIYREVVSQVLPLSVFHETPSLCVDEFRHPSFRIFSSGTRIYRRGLGRPPRPLCTTGGPCEGGVVGNWAAEAFWDACYPIFSPLTSYNPSSYQLKRNQMPQHVRITEQLALSPMHQKSW